MWSEEEEGDQINRPSISCNESIGSMYHLMESRYQLQYKALIAPNIPWLVKGEFVFYLIRTCNNMIYYLQVF